MSLSAPPVVPAEGSLGWGQPSSDFGQVHFKTSIASSFQVLEAAAMNRYPVLYREPSMTVANYLAFLREVCSGLQPQLCAWYVATYERARFSTDDFTLDDYKAFMDRFVVLIQAIESPQFAVNESLIPPERFRMASVS